MPPPPPSSRYAALDKFLDRWLKREPYQRGAQELNRKLGTADEIGDGRWIVLDLDPAAFPDLDRIVANSGGRLLVVDNENRFLFIAEEHVYWEGITESASYPGEIGTAEFRDQAWAQSTFEQKPHLVEFVGYARRTQDDEKKEIWRRNNVYCWVRISADSNEHARILTTVAKAAITDRQKSEIYEMWTLPVPMEFSATALIGRVMQARDKAGNHIAIHAEADRPAEAAWMIENDGSAAQFIGGSPRDVSMPYQTKNGITYLLGWHLHAIRAPEAWARFGGPDAAETALSKAEIKLAILDSPVSTTASLAQVTHIEAVAPSNTIPTEEHAFRNVHGTICAELAAGRGSHSHPTLGVAPGCHILSVRVASAKPRDTTSGVPTPSSFRPDDYEDSDIAWGIRQSAKEGAHVISLSLGKQGYSELIDLAINDLSRTGRNKLGCVFVAAAGNIVAKRPADLLPPGVFNMDFPARNPNVLAVGATMMDRRGGSGDLAVANPTVCEAISGGGKWQCDRGCKVPGDCKGAEWIKTASRFRGERMIISAFFPPDANVFAPGAMLYCHVGPHLRPVPAKLPERTFDPRKPAAEDVKVFTLGVRECFFGEATSGATPLAAGAAALILARNPGLRGCEVVTIIQRSAQKRAFLRYLDNANEVIGTDTAIGILDVDAAIELADRWSQLPDQKKLCRNCPNTCRNKT